jgi:hypothetical protein
MSIKRLFVCVLFGCVIPISSAKAPARQQAITREVALDGCHFSMRDPYSGRLKLATDGGPSIVSYHAEISPGAQHRFDTWIQFYCEKDGSEKAFSSMGMKRDGTRWVISEGSYPSLPEEHVTIHPLHGASWSGAGLTSDQTTGDIDQRMRGFGFCIAGKQQVLCGIVQQVMFLGFPRESTLPQVIKLLQSIQFIDDVASGSASAISVRQ